MKPSAARLLPGREGLDRGKAGLDQALAEAAISAAIAHLSAGRTAQAERGLDQLVPARLASPTHCTLIGRVYVTAGRTAKALPWFDRALALKPGFGEALVNRATALAKLDRLPEAVAAFAAAVAVVPADPLTFYGYGNALASAGQAAEALAAYDRALQLRPAFAEARRAAGTVLRGLGRFDGALQLFDEALRLKPDYLDAVLDRANLLHAQDRIRDALAAYGAALARWPENALLWNNRGMMLHDLGRMEEAHESLQTALRFDPGLPQAHHNRGNVLFRLGDFAAAVVASDTALLLRPRYPEALCSRGLALKMLGRFDESMAAFEAALAIDPEGIYARANRGELKLLLGQFATGWTDYDLRFFTERQAKPALKTPVPEWLGHNPPGARVVVFADQGNGDTIQFARFLPQMVARGAAVTFVCPARLQRVLRDLLAGITVRDAVGDDEVFDFQIALSSVPGAFKTDCDTLAASTPYLSAEPERVRHWAARLGSDGFRVGLCWRGSQHWQCDPKRSIPLSLLAPLAALPGLRLVSLQMPDNTGPDAAAGSIRFEPLGDDFDAGPDAFVDTAALMASLDLVVTVDTSIAHLAGALGRPVWVLLQAVPEWRWMLDRDTSPWYPTMRLFRQACLGDWGEPLQRIAERLGHCVQEDSESRHPAIPPT